MPMLAFAGDVMLGRGVDEALAHLRPEEPWGDFLPLLHAADLRIANLECALTRSRTRWREPKVFYFGGHPRNVEVLRAGRIDAVSLANNHTLDFEVAGLLETLDTLDAAGIAHAGAGRTIAEARAPCLLRAGDLTVGLVAFTDNEPSFAAGTDRPGTSWLDSEPDEETLATIAESVRAARGAGAELVVLANHWGPNMVERPPPGFRALARSAVELGVDVWFGHSAHLVQGVEIHRGRPIFYDTGDFIDDYAVDPVLRNDWSMLFLVEVEAARPVRVELVPARLSFARVNQARGHEARAIAERMRRLSAELGTRFTSPDGERLALDIAAGRSAVADVREEAPSRWW